MQYDFAVIAANGIQGRIAARRLLEDGYSVLLCANDDYKMDKLIDHPKADFAFIDLRRMDRVKRVVKKSGASVVVNCAVDDFNLVVTKMALDLGMNYIDLGSEEDMTREQRALDSEFKNKNILGVTGIGSTPGITNVMLRYAKPKFDTIDTVHVGFAWDSNQPAFVTPFSIDAIAWEFTEKAKILENGEYVDRHPYEANVDYYYKSIGKQRAQYAKHIEPVTYYEFLKDKGVKNIARYASFPTHSHRALNAMIDLGFMDKEEIQVNGVSIRPLDFTTEVLRRIPVPDGYTEKENLFLKIYGTKDRQPKVLEMDCVAGTQAGWEDATCNVDTGFPAAILAEMIKNNQVTEKGFMYPELAIEPEPFFTELAQKELWVYENGKKINGLDNGNRPSGIKMEETKITAVPLAKK